MSTYVNKRRAWRYAIALLCAALVATGVAAAAGKPKVTVQVDVAREVVRTDVGGSRIVVEEPVTNVSPGDVLVYRLTAANIGKAPARNARLQDPIPAGTVLVPESLDAGGTAISASIDNGETFRPFPIEVEVTAADGSVVRVPAPAGAYTHLRWQLAGDIAPGSETSVSFKVRVD